MQKLYQKMWQQGIVAYQNNQFFIDEKIGEPTDTRRGITLLARLSQPIQKQVNQFLNEFKAVCPNQYCYPESDLHLTIMSIVSCKEGYMFNENEAQKYLDILKVALVNSPKFSVNFSGITASNSGVMLTGYTNPRQLENLRGEIRNAIKNNTLEHSMDSRYKIETAHSTILRYVSGIKDSQLLIGFLEGNLNRQFGEVKIDTVELVYNDWYQTKAKTNLVGKISLI